MSALPIDDVLPAIRAALDRENKLVIAAPPGAGKTTRVPIALLDEAWLAGKRILLLEPRRIAARMAADRMAAILKEKTGGRIGLSTRVDRKVSAATRIEVVTDGLFTRRLLNDPELADVGAVIFDEFHERSLNIDIGLALALDMQAGLRPDLKIVLMSATLDTKRTAARIGAATVESEGRLFPVETIYTGKTDERIEKRAERVIRRALYDQRGSILVFLPGMGEIARTAELLHDVSSDVTIAPLYGALAPAEQDRAVAPAPPGHRKVVLATDIAESSLTIEGVHTVIDSGLSRVADYADYDGGGAVLVTRRAARANVDQRRGRAGRLGPGVCYRLWDEEATRGLSAEPQPEILAADLSGLLLALAEWGERDPQNLVWIDPPPPGRIAQARERLFALGAIDAVGALTPRGRAIASLPLEPRLAAMIVSAQTDAEKSLAAEIAIIVSERGLGGDSADLRDRVARFRKDNSARAAALRKQAARWTKDVAPAPISEAGKVIAGASPLSIARARDEPGQFLLAGGRAAFLDPASPLAAETWIAVSAMTGSAAKARITGAAPLSEADALSLGVVETVEIAEFDTARKSFRAKRVKRLGAIVLSQTPLAAPSGGATRTALLNAIRALGFEAVGDVEAIRETQARLALLHNEIGPAWPLLDDNTLIERADEWLTPLLGDPPSMANAGADRLRRGMLSLIDADAARRLDRYAPRTIDTPTGRALAIDYRREGGPLIEARVQEFYGLSKHPAIAEGKIPLVVSLLSPARRQIALTKNLPDFWRGGYRDMAKDMRSQYPKHDWPENPAAAPAHAGKTKAALKREK